MKSRRLEHRCSVWPRLALAALLAPLGCALALGQDNNNAVEQLTPEANPAVRAAMELPRTEPRHYLSAILALVDLGRPDLAVPVLKELEDLHLNDQHRADLVDQFGSHRMLQLGRAAALAPAGQRFIQSCMAAAAARARDPAHVAKLIREVGDPSAEVRRAARVDLAAAGQPGVIALLEALARETDPARRRALAAAAESMGALAVAPLVAMSAAENDYQLRADALRVLGRLRVASMLPLIAADAVEGPPNYGNWSGSPEAARAAAAQAVQQMSGQLASTALAEQLLTSAIADYHHGAIPFPLDEHNRIALWQWNGGSKRLEPRSFTVDDARTIWLARLAQALAELRPDQQPYLRQFLVLGMEADALLNEADAAADVSLTAPGAPGGAGHTPAGLNELLATGHPALIGQALSDAIKQRLPRAAAQAARVLGSRHDPNVLYAAAPLPAPLVEALQYPDRRVRLAALEAIMVLDPQSPFPGSSRVPDTLGYFARGAGQRQALVAMPTIEAAATLAGRLGSQGIDAAVTNRGSTGVGLARQMGDLEFILVDMDIQAPGIREVLYALRTDPSTGRIPIGLLAGAGRLEAAQALVGEHDRMIAFSRPRNDDAATAMIARLTDLAGHDLVTPAERSAQAAKALTWLADLAARGPAFYDLGSQADAIEAALERPEAAGQSIAALAALGTPSGQRALVDFASRGTLPIAVRRQAARAFGHSVQRHRLLLTESEILRQYDRYNASVGTDADTQRVLGSLLDTIESPRERADERAVSNAQ